MMMAAAEPPESTPHRPEDEAALLESARGRLEQRVRETLDRRTTGEADTPVLTLRDVQELRRLPNETLKTLVEEVVRDTIKIYDEASETDEVTEETEVTAPLLDQIDAQEKVAADLEAVETMAREIVADALAQQETAPDTGILNLETADIPEAVKEQVIQKCIDLVARASRSAQEYTVIASTAMYLKAKAIEATGEKPPFPAKLPGDLDMVVFNDQSMRSILSGLSGLRAQPGVVDVQVDRPEKLAGEDTTVYRGSLTVEEDGKKYLYPFEIFLNTRGTHRLLRDTNMQLREKMQGGLQILNMEGLQNQIAANERLERRVVNNVELIRRVLTEDPQILSIMRQAFTTKQETGAWPESIGFAALTRELQMEPDRLAQLYVADADLQEALQAGDTAKAEALRGQLSRIVGPFKTKLEKRERNVSQIMQARTAKDTASVNLPPQ